VVGWSNTGNVHVYAWIDRGRNRASTRKGACKSRVLSRRQRTCAHSLTQPTTRGARWRSHEHRTCAVRALLPSVHDGTAVGPAPTPGFRTALRRAPCAPSGASPPPQGLTLGDRPPGMECSSRLPLTGRPFSDTPVSTPRARVQRRRWAGAIGMGGHGPGGGRASTTIQTRCSVPVSGRVLLPLEARCWSLAHHACGTSAMGDFMGRDWPIQGAVDKYRCHVDSLEPAHPSGPPSLHRQNRLRRRSLGLRPRRSAGNTVRPLRRVRG
jgi:hypothetical protein